MEINFLEIDEKIMGGRWDFVSSILEGADSIDTVNASIMASIKENMSDVIQEIKTVGGIESKKGQEVFKRIVGIAPTKQGKLDLMILIFNEYGTRG